MIRKSTFAATLAKLFGTAAIAATLCASSSAQAGVLTFEGYGDTAITDGVGAELGKYYLETGGGGFGLIGNTAGTCTSDMACPANNASTYFASLADGYAFLEMLDGSAFSLASIDASFLGFNGQSYPSLVAGLLRVTAFDALGQVGSEIYLNLTGPSNGAFNFSTFDLTALGGGSLFTTVRFVSYACEVGSTTCNRSNNQAQFALDNLVTVNASDVPEPGSFALMGLGLFGIGAMARRRKAAAAI